MTDSVVLVTGAAGFLGSRVVTRLSQGGGHRIIAVDAVRSMAVHALEALPNVEFRAFDLRDHDSVESAVAGATHVVHLAAVRSQLSEQQPQLAFEINISATHDLLTLAARHQVCRFIYGSSHLVYGDFHDAGRRPFTEDDAAPGSGLSLYAAAKLASEALMEPIARQGGFEATALRFGGIYGPGAATGSNSSAMLDALSAIDRGERPAVSWSRDTQQALIFVDDAARAVVAAIGAPNVVSAVNVVGEPVRILDIFSTLVSLYGHDPAVIDWRDERRRFQLVDGGRLRSVLACSPTTSLEDGLRSIIAEHLASG